MREDRPSSSTKHRSDGIGRPRRMPTQKARPMSKRSYRRFTAEGKRTILDQAQQPGVTPVGGVPQTQRQPRAGLPLACRGAASHHRGPAEGRQPRQEPSRRPDRPAGGGVGAHAPRGRRDHHREPGAEKNSRAYKSSPFECPAQYADGLCGRYDALWMSSASLLWWLSKSEFA